MCYLSLAISTIQLNDILQNAREAILLEIESAGWLQYRLFLTLVLTPSKTVCKTHCLLPHAHEIYAG